MKTFLKKHQSSIGMFLMVFGGTYQALNAIWWGWWAIDTRPFYFSEAAIFNGRTLNQLIAIHFGFLAGPLFAISLILLITGIALIWIDTDECALPKQNSELYDNKLKHNKYCVKI
jgi:hypothetical protein